MATLSRYRKKKNLRTKPSPVRFCAVAISVCLHLLLTSCQKDCLYIHSEHITYEDLASYHVGTPDPRKDCPDIGQRLLIYWNLPKKCLRCRDVCLRLRLRFGNQEEKMLAFALDQPSGLIGYDLINEEYYKKNGLLTYKAEIVADGNVIDQWRHQIWTERINFELHNTADSDTADVNETPQVVDLFEDYINQ